jgi:hypothetical protein
LEEGAVRKREVEVTGGGVGGWKGGEVWGGVWRGGEGGGGVKPREFLRLSNHSTRNQKGFDSMERSGVLSLVR